MPALVCVLTNALSTPVPALTAPAGSNTGCLCAQSLSGCELLLRGHTPHDEQLEALLADPHYTTGERFSFWLCSENVSA